MARPGYACGLMANDASWCLQYLIISYPLVIQQFAMHIPPIIHDFPGSVTKKYGTPGFSQGFSHVFPRFSQGFPATPHSLWPNPAAAGAAHAAGRLRDGRLQLREFVASQIQLRQAGPRDRVEIDETSTADVTETGKFLSFNCWFINFLEFFLLFWWEFVWKSFGGIMVNHSLTSYWSLLTTVSQLMLLVSQRIQFSWVNCSALESCQPSWTTMCSCYVDHI